MLAIEVRNLQWTPILRGVNFELRSGEALGLLGPNGSGKSTLLRVLSGVIDDLPFYPRDALDAITLGGSKLSELNAREVSKRVVYLGGELNSEFPILVDQVTSTESLQFFEVAFLARRRLNDLSSGERQMVALARAHALGAPIWFLDEALVKLDLNHRKIVLDRLQALRTQGYAFVLVSHDLSWIERLCTSALWLKEGRSFASGPVSEMLDDLRVGSVYKSGTYVPGKN